MCMRCESQWHDSGVARVLFQRCPTRDFGTEGGLGWAFSLTSTPPSPSRVHWPGLALDPFNEVHPPPLLPSSLLSFFLLLGACCALLCSALLWRCCAIQGDSSRGLHTSIVSSCQGLLHAVAVFSFFFDSLDSSSFLFPNYVEIANLLL